jgi:NADH dehydrogenase FAD-containing subunit
VRIVVLGGGFGGVTAARHLERRLRGQPDADITLVPAWWVRRTYYLFQMPRWDRRLRIIMGVCSAP